MFILLPALLLLITAAALAVLQVTQPAFRYAWLIASAGALLAWLTVWLWLPAMPIAFGAQAFVGGARFLARMLFVAAAGALVVFVAPLIVHGLESILRHQRAERAALGLRPLRRPLAAHRPLGRRQAPALSVLSA